MRNLSADEAALWERVAATIRPLSREPVANVAPPTAPPAIPPPPDIEVVRGRVPPARTPVAPPAPANDNSFDVAKFASIIGSEIAAAVKPANDAVAAFGTRFDALEAKLAKTEEPQKFKRAPATGGNGSVKTDC